jgi:hypothetical protein
LSAKLPAGVDEAIERLFVVEDKDHSNLLHSKTRAGLQLNSFHEGPTPALVFDGDALSLPEPATTIFAPNTANNRLSRRPLDCCFDLWIGFIEC